MRACLRPSLCKSGHPVNRHGCASGPIGATHILDHCCHCTHRHVANDDLEWLRAVLVTAAGLGCPEHLTAALWYCGSVAVVE